MYLLFRFNGNALHLVLQPLLNARRMVRRGFALCVAVANAVLVITRVFML